MIRITAAEREFAHNSPDSSWLLSDVAFYRDIEAENEAPIFLVVIRSKDYYGRRAEVIAKFSAPDAANPQIFGAAKSPIPSRACPVGRSPLMRSFRLRAK